MTGGSMSEQFIRSQKLIGEHAIETLQKSTVAVFGVGGVGSFVVEALARGAIGTLILVDDDTICKSNLNRQIHATMKTVGQPKVEVMKERIMEINPNANVITYQRFILTDNMGDILENNIDYMVDALDTVTAKITIARMAKERNIPLISAMGTGNKLDPTQFEVTDLSKTSVCPLCKVMRRELKKYGIKHLKVVFSKEQSLTPKTFDKESAIDAKDLTQDPMVVRKKRATPGSMSFVPGVAGMILAGEVIKELIKENES